MSKTFPLRTRQIHLDFHTAPQINDVGREFDARQFARTLKRAHVNSVTVFAKCHHGHLYYNTRRPERHPGLRAGHDLLGEQVEALHREGIRAPIYLSVQCDEYAANAHPEWIARHPTGRTCGAQPFEAGWQILDMSTPYQNYLAEQTQEVLRRFKPVDGIFFDMCWDQPSLNNYFIDAMIEAGLNPESEPDRAAYARTLAHQYMKRFHAMVKASNPAASVYFNSRPLTNLATEIDYLAQVEIEALPTGGWGYQYFPKNVRFARTFNKPCLGMTARFHKSWADFGGLKPYAALEYETAQMIAHGTGCSIGDQLHPRGRLDPGAYELIGRVYERIEQREPWTIGATPLVQVGVFQKPTGSTGTTSSSSGTDEGATRLLTQLRQQFNFIDEHSRLGDYELLILPDGIPTPPALLKKLEAYLRRGGAILASGTSGLSEDGRSVQLKSLGIQAHGWSPYTTTYIRFGPELARDVPPGDHVIYDRGVRVTARGKAKSLARVVEPYFERAWNHFTSHHQTPGQKVSRFSAGTINGRTGYIPFPIFSAFATHGNYPYRLLVRNLLQELLPEPLLRAGGPTGLETSVMKQPGRIIVHLLHYTPERRTPKLDIIEDIVPLYDLPLSLKLPKKPKRVYLAPENLDLEFEHLAGRVNLRVPAIHGHAMIVFE